MDITLCLLTPRICPQERAALRPALPDPADAPLARKADGGIRRWKPVPCGASGSWREGAGREGPGGLRPQGAREERAGAGGVSARECVQVCARVRPRVCACMRACAPAGA